MLGDINPQTVRIAQQAVVYPGRDHVTALTIKRYDGRSFKPVDLTNLTRVVLVFPGTDPTIVFDSLLDSVFSWSGNTLTVDLSDYAMPASIQQTHLIVYDAEHLSGQVLVDNIDARLEFDFRNIIATGTTPPPTAEAIADAPLDGGTYGRRGGAWVSLDAVVSGVASVNDMTGFVTLTAADVGADATGTAAAAVAAHEALADPHPQYLTPAEGDAAYDALGAGTAAASAAVATHVADTTPHDVITQVDKLGFDITAAQTAGVGEMVWNATDGTADLGLPGGVTLQVGQEFLIRGLNSSGATLTNGSAVYISGAQGNRTVLSLARADQATADKTIGILTQDILNNQEGFCTLVGMVRDINTSTFAEGVELWLSASVAGGITATKPPAPNNAVRIGYVVRSHASVGAIFVRVQHVEALRELHDVVVINPLDGDILEYDTATSTWINVPNTGGSGEANTASNLGAGEGLFAGKVLADLQFKSLVGGTNVTITSDATTVTISATGGGGGSVDSVNGQTGVVVLGTDGINEGVSNLYFTNVRAAAAAPVQTVDGQTGAVSLSASYAPLSHVGDGGAAHANVVAAGAAGFMTGADKTKLDGVATGANLYVHPNHSGDVTSVGDGAQTIANNAVTNAKAADMVVNTIKGRITTGTGDPEDLTATQVRTIINVANGATANSTDAQLRDRTTHTGVQAISTVTGLQTALDKALYAPVITESTTARNLALTDGAAYIRHTNTGASTVTVPPQSSVAWLADTEIHIRRAAAANLTLTPGAGVTLNAPSGGTLVLTDAMSATLKRVAADVWDVIGQTVAA